MSTLNDGGPVFPHRDYSGKTLPGMSLRDKFALKAIDALPFTTARRDLSLSEISIWCYQFADAMLMAKDANKGRAQ